jgi:hypothetical protein
MTDERNFDRITRAWLDLMPDEAPDRTIAAVLQAVETAPQVRSPWRWLTRRFPNMNRLSMAAALAAAAVLAVGGGLWLTRSNGPSIGQPSPTPTSTASPSGSAAVGAPLPVELRSRWYGGHRDFVQLDKGSTLLFTGNSFVMTESNQWDSIHYLDSSAAPVGDGQFRLESTEDGNECGIGDVGLYSWSLSPSGKTLTITADADDCAARSAAVPGVWWQAGGPNELCLGELDPGTYKSQYIVPRLDQGATWEPDFGGLTYTVPEGWANSDDGPVSFELVPASEMPPVAEADRRRNIGVFTQPTAMTQDKPCSDTVLPGIGRTVPDLVTWLRTVPGLITTAPTAVTIDGHPGQTLEVRLDPAWTKTCAGSTEPLVTYFNPGLAVGPDQRERLFLVDLVDLGDDDVVAIAVWTRGAETFDAFIPEAMSVIDSFSFK